MIRDWDRVLENTNEWTGRAWAECVCAQINKFTSADGLFLTLGPGMVGTEAWVINELCPNMKVLGYEPQTDRYNFLKEKFPGELVNKAVTAHHGTIKGWMGHKDGKSDFWLNASTENQKFYKEQFIDSTTVDDILEDIPDPVVLWMDIEGAEFDALRGAIKSLSRGAFWFVCVELNFVADDDTHCYWADVVELLRKNGYIAWGCSSSPKYSINEATGEKYVTVVETNGHTDVAFVRMLGDVPRDYLSGALLSEGE